MRIATALAIAFLASPAAAELATYKGSDGRIFPNLERYVPGHWSREPAPRIGVNGGQINPEFQLAETSNQHGPMGRDRSGMGGGRDGYGGNYGVKIDAFGAAWQGARQEGGSTASRSMGGGTMNTGGSTGVGVCGCH